MKNTKRKLIGLALAILLVLVCVIGTTLAYFTDTESAKTTMVSGNVSISQASTDLSSVTLLPAVYADTNADGKADAGSAIANKVNYAVSVTNAGNVDVYARTILAFETNAKNLADKIELLTTNQVDVTEIAENVTIGAGTYRVVILTYKAEIAPSATVGSIEGFYLRGEATMEDMVNISPDYTVLALSQAVQADGFADATAALTAAFGAVDAAKANTWMAALDPIANP